MGSFAETLGLLFEVNADPTHAVTAVKLFEEQVATSMGVSKKSFEQFGAASAAAAKDLAYIGAGAVGVGAALFGLAEHAAAVGDEIYKAHEKTGLADQSLSALMAISKQTGGSFEALTTSLTRAGVNLEKTTESGGKANKLLYELMGGAQGAAELGLKPMDERIQIVLQRIFTLNDVGQRNTALTELMGRGWQSNTEMLKLLAEQGYAPAIEMAKQLGLYFDPSKAAEAHNFMIEVNTLKAEFSGMALMMGQELIPYLERLVGWLHTAGKEAEVMALRTEALGAALRAPMTGGVSLIQVYKDLHAATKLEDAAIQEQTDWLVKLQTQMKVAGAAAGDTPGAGGPGGKPLGTGAREGAAGLARIASSAKAAADAMQVLVTASAAGDKASFWTQPTTTQLQPQIQQFKELDLTVHTLSRDVIQELVPAFEKDVPRSLSVAQKAMQMFRTEASSDFKQVEEATLTAGIAAAIYGNNIGKAMEEAAKSTLASIAEQAGVQALYALAQGLWFLAQAIFFGNPDAGAAAAVDFEAAAQYGAIAAVAGGAAAAIPSGAGRGAGAGAGAGSRAGTETGAGSGAGGRGGFQYPGAGPQSLLSGQSIHLEFNGGAICPHCAQDIAANLTRGVENGTLYIASNYAFKLNARS